MPDDSARQPDRAALPPDPPQMAVVAPAGRIMTSEQRPVAAIVWMLATMGLFVSMDAVAKVLTQTLPPGEIVWGRFVFHALFVGLFLNRRLVVTLRAGRPGLQLLRSAFLLVTTAFFFFGLKFLGLATMSAIMFVTPLLVTLLSMPILGERVGWRRITSVLMGFAGALIIIRPGSDAIGLAALLPLTAALFNAAYHLATRVLSRTDAALTTVGYTAIVGAVMSNFALLGGWVTPDATGWAMLVGLGLIGCLGHFTLIRAYSLANAAVAAPFGYTSLIWATLFGLALFGELPDLWTVAGAAVIVGSGLYILYRERARKAGQAAADRAISRETPA